VDWQGEGEARVDGGQGAVAFFREGRERDEA
jgi:hypothetical protein